MIDNGGVGLAELDGGDVRSVRARIEGAEGAAIALAGAASLLRTRLVENGGGVTVADGSLSLGRSAIVRNAGVLGGIVAVDASVATRQSTIGGNATSGDGGGIALAGDSSLAATNTTIAENFAAGSGGGLFAAPAVGSAAERGHRGPRTTPARRAAGSRSSPAPPQRSTTR